MQRQRPAGDSLAPSLHLADLVERWFESPLVALHDAQPRVHIRLEAGAAVEAHLLQPEEQWSTRLTSARLVKSATCTQHTVDSWLVGPLGGPYLGRAAQAALGRLPRDRGPDHVSLLE